MNHPSVLIQVTFPSEFFFAKFARETARYALAGMHLHMFVQVHPPPECLLTHAANIRPIASMRHRVTFEHISKDGLLADFTEVIRLISFSVIRSDVSLELRLQRKTFLTFTANERMLGWFPGLAFVEFCSKHCWLLSAIECYQPEIWFW